MCEPVPADTTPIIAAGRSPAPPSIDLKTVECFYDAYFRALLQVVSCADQDVLHASSAWREHLHSNFMCFVPSGVAPPQEEPVLHEWRSMLQCGTYSCPFVSQACLYNRGAGHFDCDTMFGRRYRGRREEVLHNLLQLRASAAFGDDGRLRVVAHRYEAAPPVQVAGVASRSQIGQDLWVLRHFPASRLPDGGFFVEVGANHAEELSNTYLLEMAAKWRGVCVEPFPQGDWSKREASDLVTAAVGPEGGCLGFIAPGHVLGGFIDHVDLVRVQRDVPQEQQSVVNVATRSLSSILLTARPGGREVPRVIHYLSIDTEGSELDILQQWPFESFTLLSCTVEHNYREPTRTRIRELLEGQGFVLDATVEHDDYYLADGYEKYLSCADDNQNTGG